jgi:hypothetical protein
MQITALKSANVELKGMMRTVKIQDFDVSCLLMFLPPFASTQYIFGICLLTFECPVAHFDVVFA